MSVLFFNVVTFIVENEIAKQFVIELLYHEEYIIECEILVDPCKYWEKWQTCYNNGYTLYAWPATSCKKCRRPVWSFMRPKYKHFNDGLIKRVEFDLWLRYIVEHWCRCHPQEFTCLCETWLQRKKLASQEIYSEIRKNAINSV